MKNFYYKTMMVAMCLFSFTSLNAKEVVQDKSEFAVEIFNQVCWPNFIGQRSVADTVKILKIKEMDGEIASVFTQGMQGAKAYEFSNSFGQ